MFRNVRTTPRRFDFRSRHLPELDEEWQARKSRVEQEVSASSDGDANRREIRFRSPRKAASGQRTEHVVLIPAFGTTLEIEAKLKEIGVDVDTYNTTCPFVEKVWKRSAKLATEDYTIVIHGKPEHEETRATFSHSGEKGHALVIKNMLEAELLCEFITGQKDASEFDSAFCRKNIQGI